ncbi:4-alpha-glucanotransferase [Myceligenerans salitolerans]|uniref:4-alpha-glucanotransferase n=1 Tax=Myceligenerans salitolerans TaxID=1230528 RepID=UPI0027DD1444|nr:4-alpha-glucanotransferase [Myceligenerans salitolerans]
MSHDETTHAATGVDGATEPAGRSALPELPEDLAELAELCGVQTVFTDAAGTTRRVSPSTLAAVLGALGVPAASPSAIAESTARVRDDEWREMLPPAVVVRQGTETRVPVHVTDGSSVSCWIELEPAAAPVPPGAMPWRVAPVPSTGRRGVSSPAGDGTTSLPVTRHLDQADVLVEPRIVDSRKVGRATFAVPGDLPLGWHSLHAESDGATATTTLVVTPDRLENPQASAGQLWGFLTQLYSVRSRDSWGIGDLADLADLAWLTANNAGADFVAPGPLQATEPTAPVTDSPYLPTSRRFLSPLYIRVEDIRETAYLSSADRSLVEWAGEPVRDLSGDDAPIDREAVWDAKKSALEVVFTAARSAARQTAFDEFVLGQGRGLVDFATWCAIAEHLGDQEWPPDLLDPTSSAVATLRGSLKDRVEFYCWLQWVADEQLRRAHRVGLEAGMRVGVVRELASGVHPEGADVWVQPVALARGVSVGVPPSSAVGPEGRNRGLPPWHPRELAKAGYAPFRDMLRTTLRHCGALRVGHIGDLFRSWWIPGATRATAGAYVTYDHEALIGILCLEAQRAGVPLIADDALLDDTQRDYLADRGILTASVLLADQAGSGELVPPQEFRPGGFVTPTPPDLPPTASCLAGEHIDLAERLGILTEDAQVLRSRARSRREALMTSLSRAGMTTFDPSERELVEGLYRYLRDTPAAFVAVNLADAVGERRTQAQLGAGDGYPNWRIPLADGSGTLVMLEDLFESARLRSLVTVLNEEA